MNRREALQTGLSVLSAIGLDGEVATISANKPQALVITLPEGANPPDDGISQFEATWRSKCSGTVLADLPILWLPFGSKVEVIDQKA